MYPNAQFYKILYVHYDFLKKNFKDHIYVLQNNFKKIDFYVTFLILKKSYKFLGKRGFGNVKIKGDFF